jgi:hypothetical protein
MDNLRIYEAVRAVPENAQKKIGAGRLKGMTDINPMWRIKTLTEQFGICGIGWKTEIVRSWIDEGANNEIVTNVEILLYVKVDGEWSEGIPGIGGSRLVAKETSGLYTDDECYKKAYTDAISVACKALGVGADIYWNDNTKYTGNQTPPTEPPLTYAAALDMVLTFGRYNGETLRDIWKKDAEYIKTLSEDSTTAPKVMEAIRIINAEIKKANAK